MKKLLLSAALFFGLTMGSFAQFNGNFETLFGGKPTSVTLISEMGVVKSGVAFIGDSREAGQVEGTLHDMKYEGNEKSFADPNGENLIKFTTRLSFKGLAALKDETLPLSRIVQFKPLSSGKIRLATHNDKPAEDRHIIIGILNGKSFTTLATLDPKTASTANGGSGSSSAPFNYSVVDYTYTPGDEIWIYSDNNLYFWGFQFEGNTDSSYAGTNPQSVELATSLENALMRVVSTEYYNINGMLVTNPTEGVYIRKQLLEDGSSKVTKAVIK